MLLRDVQRGATVRVYDHFRRYERCVRVDGEYNGTRIKVQDVATYEEVWLPADTTIIEE